MLFINTKVSGQSSSYLSGYGESDGVKYLTLQKGSGGTVGAGTLKVALLNLGQGTDTKDFNADSFTNSDAGDLGDFYQWGRVADGHQQIGWSKNASHANIIDATGGTVDGSVTSATVVRNGSAVYDGNRQLGTNSGDYNEKFITNDGDWGGGNTADNSRWGDGSKSYSSRASDISFSAWTDIAKANNPCPSGWHVPSRWNFWDLYRGTGSDTSPSSSSYDGTNNTWVWRGASSTYAVGGAVITNASGERLFLPAAGFRGNSSGALNNVSSYGYYWSSTYSNTANAYYLYFNSSNVYAGYYSNFKTDGFGVRCVQNEN
jgi:uncharacterized protein (TIGR02145 family)